VRFTVSRRWTGDVWTDAKLLQADELVAEARAFAARRALLRDPRPPRRPVRAWLGSLLLAAGHRLLGSVPSPASQRRPLVGGSGPPAAVPPTGRDR